MICILPCLHMLLEFKWYQLVWYDEVRETTKQPGNQTFADKPTRGQSSRGLVNSWTG